MKVNCVLEMYSPSVDVCHYVLKNYCIIVSAIWDLNGFIIIIIIIIIVIIIIVILLFFFGALRSMGP